MHRFFAERHGEGFRLREEDAAHALRVLRLKEGDGIEAVAEGVRWRARISSCTDNMQVGVDLEERLKDTEPATQLVLFQGLPKADKMDTIVQKGTELGAAGFQPVRMKRSIVQGDERQMARKAERWQKIAGEAVKQCGRVQPPEVYAPVSWAQAKAMLQTMDAVFVPWEDEAKEEGLSLTRYLAEKAGLLCGRRIGLVIGPEGGISAEEIEWLREQAGALTLSLGPRILRTETAAIAAIALIMGALGEME